MTTETPRTKVAIIGSGNIGTDLMIKVLQQSQYLEMGGRWSGSIRLRRPRPGPREGRADNARRRRRPHPHGGFRRDRDRLRRHVGQGPHRQRCTAPSAGQADDRPDAGRHRPVRGARGQPRRSHRRGEREHGDLWWSGDDPDRRGRIACHARGVRRDRRSISSRSAGPGTRANIDEFTETTSKAICSVGGAQRGKAVIILNPRRAPH